MTEAADKIIREKESLQQEFGKVDFVYWQQ